MQGSDPPLLHVGQYSLFYKIGEGSFGKVFLGMHDVIRVAVAIKQIRKSEFTNERDLLRIRREIRILKTVIHQYVIELYEILEDENNLWLVMENAQHGSLAKYIAPGKPLPEMECIRIFRQVTIGLGYLHTHLNLIHRDLKAENILLDEQNNVRLIDFGLSNNFRPGARQTYCGSPNYSAPEIIKKGPYSKSADVWSLGILLYFMSTGRLPFAGQPLSKLMQSLAEEEIPIPDGLPPKLVDLLCQLLQKDPSRRIDTGDILSHPWLCEGEMDPADRYASFDSLIEDSVLDEAIIDELNQLQIDTTELADLMERGEYNEITALYRIKRRIKEIQRLARPQIASKSWGSVMARVETPEQQPKQVPARPRNTANLVLPVRRSRVASGARKPPAPVVFAGQEAARKVLKV